jgi:hypothetical protein
MYIMLKEKVPKIYSCVNLCLSPFSKGICTAYLLHHERGLSALRLSPPDDSSQGALFDHFSISESKINL